MGRQFATDYSRPAEGEMSGNYFTAQALRELESRLSPQDESLLRSVSELRFVTGAQLARLHYDGDARAARRALLRLVDLGALDRLPRGVGGVRAGSAGFVYHLAFGGQRLAIDRGWQPERRPRRRSTPGQLFVRHCLAVAELHTQLVEADRLGRLELLELVSEPSCWRQLDGLGNQRTLKPDSYARLGVGEYEDSYFFEVDRGTEGSRAVESQLASYVVCWRQGREQAERGVFPIVLWLVEAERRAEVIRACIASLPSTERALFKVAPFADLLSVVTDTEAATEPPHKLYGASRNRRIINNGWSSQPDALTPAPTSQSGKEVPHANISEPD